MPVHAEPLPISLTCSASFPAHPDFGREVPWNSSGIPLPRPRLILTPFLLSGDAEARRQFRPTSSAVPASPYAMTLCGCPADLMSKSEGSFSSWGSGGPDMN